MFAEKGREPGPRDQVHAVVEIDVTSIRNNVKFLRLRSFLEGVLAEDAGMRFVAGDKQNWTRRHPIKVVEG